MENFKQFMEKDTSDLASEHKTYTFYAQAKLADVMESCAKDTDFPLEEKNVDHGSFPWFANCVKNNVFLNPTLNQNQCVRSFVGAEW